MIMNKSSLLINPIWTNLSQISFNSNFYKALIKKIYPTSFKNSFSFDTNVATVCFRHNITKPRHAALAE